MCGRFTLTLDQISLQQAFPNFLIPAGIQPRYNIAPTQPVAVIPNDGSQRLDFFTWGLIPSWAKDSAIGSRMINARAETIAQKPSFRSAFKRRRCLILADGFYEWYRPEPNAGKTPLHFRLKTGAPFAFAGLWERWQSPDGSEIKSCTIITTRPNVLLEKIHNRMPVILPPEAYPQWLAAGETPATLLQPLLIPLPAEQMSATPVSRRVNNPRFDDPVCLLPEETK